MAERIVHVALTQSQCNAIAFTFDYMVKHCSQLHPNLPQTYDAIIKAIQAGKFRVN